MTVDGNDDLLIVDYGNHRIRKVDHVTHIISAFAGNGTNGYAGRVFWPQTRVWSSTIRRRLRWTVTVTYTLRISITIAFARWTI